MDKSGENKSKRYIHKQTEEKQIMRFYKFTFGLTSLRYQISWHSAYMMATQNFRYSQSRYARTTEELLKFCIT